MYRNPLPQRRLRGRARRPNLFDDTTAAVEVPRSEGVRVIGGRVLYAM